MFDVFKVTEFFSILLQKYNKFQVELNQQQPCPNKYKFKWTYMKISDKLKSEPDLCLNVQEIE